MGRRVLSEPVPTEDGGPRAPRGSVAQGWVRLAVLAGAGAAGLLALGRCDASGRLEPEPPETTPDEPWAMVRPVSVINVPMGIPLAPLLDLVEAAVPMRHGDLDHFEATPDSGRAQVAYDFERSPFRAFFVNDVAALSATVFYRMRVHYPLPALPDVHSDCGMDLNRGRPRLVVTLASPMSVDVDWSLRTSARIAELRPASDEDADRCEVTLFGIDITDDVVAGARSYLEENLSTIDSLVSEVDTRSRFESWWATLRDPVRLSDSVWLAMRPEAIQRGPLRGSGDSVTVELALRSRPEIVIGRRPAGRPTPLPALDSGSVVPRLDLLVDGRVEYSTASALLTEALGGSSFEMSGRTIRVESLRAYGIGSGSLALEVSVSGDLSGRLYLTGRPALDQETGLVSVPDLEFDVATRDILVATASWFGAGAFRAELRERARLPTSSAVEWLTEWLDRGLNRHLSDDLSVMGTVDSIDIVDVAAFTDALMVRVSARGSAKMFVRDRADEQE